MRRRAVPKANIAARKRGGYPMSQEQIRPALPWWRVRMVWLVVGGPAVVVVASFITLYLAVSGGDRAVYDTAAQAQAYSPATQARNHAATPRH